MRNRKQQQGIALLEVLIAIGVMAFGFLALLKLQMTSLNNVVASNQRYVAAEIAQTMGERIRANFTGLAGYNGKSTSSAADCSSGSCSTIDNDLYQWKTYLEDTQDALPSGVGTIAVNGQSAVVTVVWRQKRDKEDQTYMLEVPINDNL